MTPDMMPPRGVNQDEAALAPSDEGVCPSKRLASLKVAVGIATVGRPAVLAQMLQRLKKQTRAPDKVVVCAPNLADVEGMSAALPEAKVLTGPRGLPHQRNVILNYLHDYDLVVFFDDDFVPCARYLENIEEVMLCNPDVVLVTGRVLKDGILGPGLDFETADTALELDSGAAHAVRTLVDVFNAYGCNMSVRIATARVNAITFDERLPLYGWLEDVDFSRRLVRFGRVVRSEVARGVHLGIKSGRQSGFRLGYSQIANPLYLMGKGTYTWSRGFYQISCNLAANVIRSLWPEAYVDRRGRLFGNARAFLDLVSGRLDPSRILFLRHQSGKD